MRLLLKARDATRGLCDARTKDPASLSMSSYVSARLGEESMFRESLTAGDADHSSQASAFGEHRALQG